MKKFFIFFSIFMVSLLQASHEPVWMAPVVLSNTGVDSFDPDVAMDSSGNITTAWIENGVVYSKTKPFGRSWSVSVPLSGTNASQLKILVDSGGDVTAIWLESGIVKIRTKSSGIWGTITDLSSAGATTLDLVVNVSKDLVAIWKNGVNIESKTKAFGQSWSATEILTTNGGSNPKVAIGNGDVIAVWQEISGPFNAIFSSEKPLLGTWSAPVTISDTTSNAAFPNIDVSNSGDAIAIWYQYDVNGSIFSNVVCNMAFKPNTSPWASPMGISDPGIRDPADLTSQVIFDSDGDSLFLWTNSTDGSSFTINWCIRKKDRSATKQNSIVYKNLYAYDFDVSMDAFNNSYLSYMNYDKKNSARIIQICGIDIDAAFKYSWLYFYSLSIGQNNGFPKIATTRIGGTNEMACVWVNYDGIHTIIAAATGSTVNPSPPISLTIQQDVNNFGVFNEYYNTFTWIDNPDPEINFYAIYRNGIFIKSVLPGKQIYIDHNQHMGESVTYGIVSMTREGFQSETATITLP